MSSFENVVGGKLKLKGKALNVKAGGIKKKKKKTKHHGDDKSDTKGKELFLEGGSSEIPNDDPSSNNIEADKAEKEMQPPLNDDILTPAERRYIEQRERIDMRRLAKTANKSHRDRIQDFNQYLANMSEHYDIPKVGPGWYYLFFSVEKYFSLLSSENNYLTLSRIIDCININCDLFQNFPNVFDCMNVYCAALYSFVGFVSIHMKFIELICYCF